MVCMACIKHDLVKIRYVCMVERAIWLSQQQEERPRVSQERVVAPVAEETSFGSDTGAPCGMVGRNDQSRSHISMYGMYGIHNARFIRMPKCMAWYWYVCIKAAK